MGPSLESALGSKSSADHCHHCRTQHSGVVRAQTLKPVDAGSSSAALSH